MTVPPAQGPNADLPNIDAASRQAAGEDAVLEVLGEFQAGVESLKSLYAQRVAMASDLKKREADLNSQLARVQQAETQLKQQQAQHAEASESFDRAQSEFAQRQAEFQRGLSELNQQRQAIEAAQKSLAVRDAALQDQNSGLDATNRRVGELERELAQIRAGAVGEAASAAQAAEAIRADLATARGSINQLTERLAQLTEASKSLQEQLSSEQDKSAGLQDVLDEQIQHLTAERTEMRKLAKELAAAKAAPGETRSKVEADIQRLTQSFEAERGTLRDQLEAAKAEHTRLCQQVEAARTSQGGSDDVSRAKLEKAAQFIQTLRQESEAQKAEIDQLKSAVQQAKSASAADGKASVRAVSDEWTQTRRQRLRRARKLVRDQDAKIKKAGEVLRTRFEQCEQVLALRSELVSARDTINAARRKAERSKSQGRTAAVVFYSIGAVLSLGAMSWIVTGFVTPGVYSASATLKAESRSRELNAAEYGEWQSFHEQLLNDPRFHETAAERMSRRGITSLSTPGAISLMVKNDLTTRAGNEGEMVVELRGEGAERTSRVLETLTTALASHANSSRQQRVDGAVTSITQAAKATNEPIDNTRMLYAAACWAVSSFLTFITGLLVWRRMLNIKHTFENQARVDELLDGANWSMPTITGPLRSVVPADAKSTVAPVPKAPDASQPQAKSKGKGKKKAA